MRTLVVVPREKTVFLHNEDRCVAGVLISLGGAELSSLVFSVLSIVVVQDLVETAEHGVPWETVQVWKTNRFGQPKNRSTFRQLDMSENRSRSTKCEKNVKGVWAADIWQHSV